MKTALIIAAAATLLAATAPGALAKGPSDMEIFCKVWPVAAKCHSAAQPAPMKVAPMKTAMAAPAKPAMSAPHIKMLQCTKSTSGKYLLDCAWK